MWDSESLRKSPLVPITEMELEIFNAVANPRLIPPLSLCLFRNVSSFTLPPKEGAVSILCTAPPKKKRSDESSFLRSLPFAGEINVRENIKCPVAKEV